MAEAQDVPPELECNPGDTQVKIRRCMSGGGWQEGWISASEFDAQTAAVVSPDPILAAIEKGWNPADVLKLAEILKAKKPCS